MELPWTELLRPKKINDLFGIEIKNKLNIMKEENDIPNLILYGNSGLGKTSSILALANELTDGNVSKQVLELNASDERGIEIVRNKIKMFSNKKIVNERFRKKIIILDEADNLTPPAQQALRYLMSENQNVSFILSCNNLNLIIEPIQSRCKLIRYKKIEEEEIIKYIEKVSKMFNIKITKKVRDKIISDSNGDIRYLTNILQKIHYYQEIGFKVNKKIFNNREIEYLIDNILDGKDLKEIFEDMTEVINNGSSLYDIINGMIDVIYGKKMDYELKFELLELMSKIKIDYSDGLISTLQINSLLIKLLEIVNKYKNK